MDYSCKICGEKIRLKGINKEDDGLTFYHRKCFKENESDYINIIKKKEYELKIMKRILKKYGSNFKTERPVKNRKKLDYPKTEGIVIFE